MYNTHYDTECPTCPYCDYEDEFDFLADKEDYIEPGEFTCSNCGKTYELCTNVIGGEYELWSATLDDEEKEAPEIQINNYPSHTWIDEFGREWQIIKPNHCLIDGKVLLYNDNYNALCEEILKLSNLKNGMSHFIDSHMRQAF